MSEADQSLDSTQLMGEDDYGAGLQRRSSRQRRAREWGDEVAADWCGQKGSQSDDYSDEGESSNPPLKICTCVHPSSAAPHQADAVDCLHYLGTPLCPPYIPAPHQAADDVDCLHFLSIPLS